MIDAPAMYILLLLSLVPALAIWQLYRRRREAVPINCSHVAHSLSWTWRRSTVWVTPTLRFFGISALIIAAARPFDWRDSEWVDAEGIAIEMVIDRSGSMRADDYLLDGRRVSRLHAVVEAAAHFVVGNPTVGSRHQDLIGLITFAREAETACPLTLDHEQVVARLEQIEAAVDYREDGTAIGDGLGLAVAELQSLDESLRRRDPNAEVTRVVVLLTDGEQNAGESTPEAAARLARHYGIRTYIIGLQPTALTTGVPSPTASHSPDSRLQRLAESTGGKFFSVSETESLGQIYASIDALERTTLAQQRLATRRQWAIDWFRLGPFGLPPVAFIAFLALVTETILQRTVYTRAL